MTAPNRLAQETSPYLRQHADNPVDWYPWGDEAFRAARERDVPVLLSVGYSACHWCHVMAHESFEDPDTAAAMNAAFVNVKVDREERPDVDAVYMDAVQALTGRGGWPMTVLMDADGRPFWGGTYFSRDNLLKVVDTIADVWTNRRGELEQNATALLDVMGRTGATVPKADLPGLAAVNDTLGKIAASFDPEWGGFGRAPKFPSTHHLQLILRAYMTSAGDDAKRVLTTTLDAMASGGMYDHLSGGFARYSTDREWLVPHFEKMLYDQALMVRIYRQAFSVFGAPQYRAVVEETIDYVLRELRHPDGGFYSSVDADSPDDDGRGVEGLFHTWTPDEVRAALAGMDDDVIELTIGWYGISDEGNFDGRSVPNRLTERGQLRRPPSIEEARQRLLAARSRRRPPAVDDKILTEWNALFLYALADAACTHQRADWTAAAVANGEFLLRELRHPDGRWYRSWHADGRPQARHDALAADHAALIDAFVRLAELTGEARWIEAARSTAETMLDWFWDPEQGGLYTTAEDAESLVVRQKDVFDNATPSANSTAAIGLQRLAALTGELRYQHQADRILQLLATVIAEAPGSVSNALAAVELRQRGLVELAVVGDAPDMVRVAQVLWRPDVVLAWGEPYDSPLWENRLEGHAYLCRNFTCEAPVTTPEALYEQLTGRPAPEGLRLTGV
ncbi:MAG: thioredoxin domain-containing protein [Ilumatobacteraceae bacterium]